MSRVEFVAIPTAQRPVELRRAVQSFSGHLAQHHRTQPVIVFHSPQSQAEQNEVTEVLQGTGGRGVEVGYVGLAEKVALARQLKRASGLSPALLEFALFPRGRQPPATGANRNAVLLWGAGGGMLSTDDDTLADLHAHPDLQPGAQFIPEVGEGDPSDYFVPETGDLSPWRLAPGDLRLPQGGLLGSVDAAWGQSAAIGEPASLVFAGLAGDCGWSAPFGFWGMPLGYLLLGGPTLGRLTATPQQWAQVLRSRRLLRATNGPRLARKAPGMSTCFGIDASTPLPPFMPVGRGQDLLFCALVERFGGRPSAWLPFAIGHEPASARHFHDGELLRAAGGLDLCSVIFALLETGPPPADLVAFGRHLQSAAAQGDGSFVEALSVGRRSQQRRLINAARERAARLDLPDYWRHDVERFCERAADALESPAPLWVVDAGASDARESIAVARGFVARYGALCEAWPSLWNAAVTRNRAEDHRSRLTGSAATAVVVPALLEHESCVASPYQTWLWRAFLIGMSDTAHVTFRAFRGTGDIAAGRLEQALQALSTRHDLLRCRFRGTEDGEALLELRPASELTVDVRAPMHAAERVDAREKESHTPIDLAASLPLRATLVPLAETPGTWELWLTFHHIALDGVSEEIFWRDIETIEHNLVAGRPALQAMPPLHATFRQIAQRQRSELAAVDSTAVENHWREKLAGAPEEVNVSCRTRSSPRDNAAVRVRREVPVDLVARVIDRARTEQTSVATLFLTAWQAVLARWSSESDIVTAVDQANRWTEAEEQAIGLFMIPLPLRADLSGDPPLQALLHANRARLAEAISWRHIPFERLIKAIGGKGRRVNGFDHVFTHLVRRQAPRLQGVTLEPLEPEQLQVDYELGLTVEESATGIALILIGSRGLYDPLDLARLGDGMVSVLQVICDEPHATLSRIDWLSDADRAWLARINDTKSPFPDEQPLTDLLRATALKHPDATALEAGEQRVSYGVLWQQAQLLAARLMAAGVDRDVRVGLFIDREPAMLTAMLGVLLAGGGYVPLDPAFPDDRLAFMIEDSRLRVLLTTRRRAGSVPHCPGTLVLYVDEPVDVPPQRPRDWIGPHPDSLAYVLYTSGSTGRPKGVEIIHRSLVSFLWSMARQPGLCATDVLLAITTISGDIAGLELWLPLLVGARIVLAPPEVSADGEQLSALLVRSRATVLQATPSTWRLLFTTGWVGNPQLKGLVGGEELPLDLARQLARSCGEAWNLYGPTETTIWSSAWKIPRDVQAVRIGLPIANTTLLVLDERRRQLPIGVTGQLYIGGVGVARGYLGRAELNAERFVPDLQGDDGRLYATGDLARWMPDGTLDFLGRNDEQVKMRGFRIEPGEIESALLRLPEVAQAVVVLHRPATGDGRLVAYLVPKPGATLPGSAQLRARLRTWLLDPMLPYHFVQIDRLPLTQNGKADRRRLAGYAVTSEPAGPAEPTAPASALEAALIQDFSRMLGIPAELDTDFFEAGGDSLRALRLIARLVKTLHVELTTGELFLHSTPRRMAARLEEVRSTTVRPRHLVPMREGRGRDPVFFVHPIGGHLMSYARLAHHIDPAAPLYGLQAAVTPKCSYGSIEARCAAYVSEILEQWSGPVTLCGYSLGGVLALEIAAQLRCAGREVPMVILLDANVPHAPYKGLVKILFRVGELLRFSWSDRRIWITDQLTRRFLGAGPGGHDLGEGQQLLDDDETRLIERQALDWRPPAYTGKVLLFAADRHLRGYSRRRSALGWDACCSDLHILYLPCDHCGLMLEPQVLRVSAAIDALLKSGVSAPP